MSGQSEVALDERNRTLSRFIKDGRLVKWPRQLQKQMYIAEEVAKLFRPGVHYAERDVNTILKNIYQYDHCTLRRYLIDMQFLKRANGFYWKES